MLKKVIRLASGIPFSTLLLAASLVLCFGIPMQAQALAFHQISHVYFFGDSLTDSGFNDLWSLPAPLPTGKAPTFTTFSGYTWAQYLARDIKGFSLPIYPGPTPPDTITNNSIYSVPGFVSGSLNGIDYAAGGSTTNSAGINESWAPSLHLQISQYLATAPNQLEPNAVYFIWSGANDILELIFSAPPIPTELQLLNAAKTAALNIGHEAARLSARGAKRIVVLSLPNIGYTPLINEIATAFSLPALPASMKNITFTFNSMLNTELGKVIAQYGTKILYIDIYTLLDKVILATKMGQPYVVAGHSFLFVNYKDPACASVLSSIYCPSTAPNNYIFSDALHPTNMAHRLLSLQVETELQLWN